MSGDNLLKQLGEELRRLRKFKKMSQEEVSERAELHPTYYGQVERGEVNPSIKTFLQVAKAIGIDPSQLLASCLKGRKSDREAITGEIILMLQKANPKQLMLVKRIISDTLQWTGHSERTRLMRPK